VFRSYGGLRACRYCVPGHLFVPGADDAPEEKGNRRRADQPERATDHDPCGDAHVDTLLPLGCLEVVEILTSN
jgi:hypothetical protein